MILGDCSQTKQTKETVSGGRNLEPQPADRTKEIDKKIIKDNRKTHERHKKSQQALLAELLHLDGLLVSVCRVGHCLPCHRLALEVLGHDFPWAPWLSVGSNWVFGVASQAVQRTDVSGRPVLFEEGHASAKAFLCSHPEQPNSGCLSSLSYMLRLASALWL